MKRKYEGNKWENEKDFFVPHFSRRSEAFGHMEFSFFFTSFPLIHTSRIIFGTYKIVHGQLC